MFKTINPYTEEIIQEYPYEAFASVDDKIQKSVNAQKRWQKLSVTERVNYFDSIIKQLEKHKTEAAKIMTSETGKPISQSYAEIEKCKWVCEYYIENAANHLAIDEIAADARRSFVSYQPLGVILGIMPWNFPFWQVFRFAIPTIIAGNSILIKHAPNVSGCALLIEKIFNESKLPNYLYQNIIVDVQQIEKIIAKSEIQGVSLTGSVRAGKSVAEIAGKYLKKTVLELGGSDPYLIFPDADLQKAAKSCVTSRMINSGQSCIAAKRFIVHHSVLQDFTKLVVKEMQKYKLKDPKLKNTNFGVLARNDLRKNLHRQVTESIEKGAQLILGGDFSGKNGYGYQPTVLTDVHKEMPAYSEELFGPVASIISAKSEEEMIEIANDTGFGLGAALYTNDVDKALRIAEKLINAGACFINDFVRSDPRLPFGGIKTSGIGRELGRMGIREFVNAKTIAVY